MQPAYIALAIYVIFFLYLLYHLYRVCKNVLRLHKEKFLNSTIPRDYEVIHACCVTLSAYADCQAILLALTDVSYTTSELQYGCKFMRGALMELGWGFERLNTRTAPNQANLEHFMGECLIGYDKRKSRQRGDNLSILIGQVIEELAKTSEYGKREIYPNEIANYITQIKADIAPYKEEEEVPSEDPSLAKQNP